MQILQFLLLFTFFSAPCLAQKQFKVKVQFPSSINLRQLAFYASNGKGTEELKPSFEGTNTSFTGDFYGKYATLTIVYVGKTRKLFYKNTFWLNEKPANITFTESDSTQNFLAINKTHNAFELKKMGEDRFNDFVKLEQNDFDQFLSANPAFNKDSLAAKIFQQKANQLTQKKIDYVRKFSNDYYSIYVFRGLAGYSYANADSLKKVFKTVFSVATQKSFEGNEIEKILNGRILAKGNFTPKFIAKDIKGNKVSLENLKGKNVLLVFWATWCGPCVAEIPQIKEIRKMNSVDNLEVISVSLDSDYAKYREGLKKYQMDWTQIYGDNDLIKTYGVTGIPVVYLIDKSGKIIYSRDEEKDNSLTVLTKLLAEKL